ncbi:single-stranded DNA exonuclease [Acetobacter sp. DsW_063]|nr:single-stranded DNA exonuclease [Acetobacter sp. DsW_063]
MTPEADVLAAEERVDQSAALGVETSCSGRPWRWRDGVEAPAVMRLGSAIAQRYGTSEIVGRIMALREVGLATASDFLEPTLRALMPDPSCVIDMDVGAARLARAVRDREAVGVFGDYDVDGACASALMADVLRELGCVVHTHIPDRMTEGYGPNAPALLSLVERGASLVVCVDCGTAASDILSCLDGRADIVVIDHHKSEGAPPQILATINPNRPECASGLGGLCAAGLSFVTAVAMVRDLRRSGWFADGRAAPDLMRQLDLVALATVCDVMPLTGLNRAFVTQGLRIMGKHARLGLSTLLGVAGVQSAPSAFSCGYALGPRINAGGRIAEADLGLRLLLSEDKDDAQWIAERLDAINRKRQDVEASILDRAMEQAEEQCAAGRAVILLASKEWHVGVVGIVAGRVKEKFNRPTLIGAELDDGVVKGSGRSVPGIDLGSAVIAAREAGLLKTGGGHAMAAGFSLATEDIPALHTFLNDRLVAAAQRPATTVLEIDAAITSGGATTELAKDLGRLAPFGNGNEEPLLVLTHVRVVRADRIGKDGATLRVLLEGEGRSAVKALLFRAGDSSLAAALEDRARPLLHVAGWLRAESWNGRETATFFVHDAAFAR